MIINKSKFILATLTSFISLINSVNSEICQDIYKSNWWSDFKNIPSDYSEWDKICNIFNNDPLACLYNRSPHRNKYKDLTDFELNNVFCTLLDQTSGTCISNPCFFYNNGKCNLQSTGGMCIWFDNKDASKMEFPILGCYRNPCHIPSFGCPQDECAKKSIKGVHECVWCDSINDEFIGCQANKLTTDAVCSNIKNEINPPRESINLDKSRNYDCQCANTSYFCLNDIISNPDDYIARFP